ncbi:hypothetical protein GCM10027586_11340 [Kineococcus gypseus]
MRVARERVRVSKRVVSEVRTVQVPVRVEQLVVEREPLDADAGDADAPAAGDTAAAEPLVIVLHEEVPVVSVRAEPVEVVRIGVRTVQGEQTVSTELRSEQVVVDRSVATGHEPGPATTTA